MSELIRMTEDYLKYDAGLDESGKDVLFGVPVCACVVVSDGATLERFRDAGVCQPKMLTDSALRKMDTMIREHARVHCSDISIPAFNDLMAEWGGNELAVLGWLHATVLYEAMQTGPVTRPLLDQFSKMDYVSPSLERLGLAPPLGFLEERSQADESEIIVAAAAICARVAFMGQLAELERRFELSLRARPGERMHDVASRVLRDNGESVFNAIVRAHAPMR